MTIVDALLQLQAGATTQRLGAAGQQPRRDLERVVRRRAAQLAGQWLQQGCTQRQAAQRLGIHERTLRHWQQAARVAAPPSLLGRPLTLSTLAQQQALYCCLDTLGPGLGVRTLHRQCHTMARAELDELVKEYRRWWRVEHMRLLHVLEWTRPGSVWAADFAKAPCRIDGRFDYLLAVRDLASGQQLLWQPVAALTADVVLTELSLLFAWHGAPWVLKTDNGSAFIADAVRCYLQQVGVYQLFSPPRCPAYNGAIEASIGSLKTRTQQHSESAGHPGLWTSVDVAAARHDANTTARPRRLDGRTPAHVWQGRRELTQEERSQFDADVEVYRGAERAERGLAAFEELSRREQAAVDRVALRRALVAHDLLLFRRRRLPPRIPRPKVAIMG